MAPILISGLASLTSFFGLILNVHYTAKSYKEPFFAKWYLWAIISFALIIWSIVVKDGMPLLQLLRLLIIKH